MSRIFEDRFRKTLGEILRRAPKMREGRPTMLRSRRHSRSESGTFSGHRAYSAGEDLRNLDWNVYARTDELFLKVLEDQDRVGLTIILDRSHSMQADDRWPGAARLAAILGGLALAHLDGLQLILRSGQETTLQGAAALGRYLELLEGLQPRDEAPRDLASQFLEQGAPGRLAWISDFADPTAMATPLAMLRQHGSRCVGWLPTLASDRRPLLDGAVRFEDPETGQQEVLFVDAALRGAMTRQLELLAGQQAAVFASVGYPLERFPVPERGDFGIASWSAGGTVYGV